MRPTSQSPTMSRAMIGMMTANSTAAMADRWGVDFVRRSISFLIKRPFPRDGNDKWIAGSAGTLYPLRNRRQKKRRPRFGAMQFGRPKEFKFNGFVDGDNHNGILK